VYISEVHGDGYDSRTYHPQTLSPVSEDYIELYNSGPKCNLNGFKLDDDDGWSGWSGNPEDVWNALNDKTFGDVVIDAGDYWLGFQDTDFSSGISSNTDVLYLGDPNGNWLKVQTLSADLDDSQEFKLSTIFNAAGQACRAQGTPGAANPECESDVVDPPEPHYYDITVIQCAPGTYSTNGFEPCQSCDAGFWTAGDNRVTCTAAACAPGTYSTNGFEPCQSCDAGLWTAGDNRVTCIAVACAPGTYNSTNGFEPCQSCDAGFWTAGDNRLACTAVADMLENGGFADLQDAMTVVASYEEGRAAMKSAYNDYCPAQS
jgi:hypothetical protein